jgi:hypothetical protein
VIITIHGRRVDCAFSSDMRAPSFGARIGPEIASTLAEVLGDCYLLYVPLRFAAQARCIMGAATAARYFGGVSPRGPPQHRSVLLPMGWNACWPSFGG